MPTSAFLLEFLQDSLTHQVNRGCSLNMGYSSWGSEVDPSMFLFSLLHLNLYTPTHEDMDARISSCKSSQGVCIYLVRKCVRKRQEIQSMRCEKKRFWELLGKKNASLIKNLRLWLEELCLFRFRENTIVRGLQGSLIVIKSMHSSKNKWKTHT